MEGMDRWRYCWWRCWSGAGGEVDVVWSLYGVMAFWGGRVSCGCGWWVVVELDVVVVRCSGRSRVSFGWR